MQKNNVVPDLDYYQKFLDYQKLTEENVEFKKEFQYLINDTKEYIKYITNMNEILSNKLNEVLTGLKG